MMNTDREALKLALEALEFFDNNVSNPAEKFITSKAITALRQALAEPDMGIDRGAWDDVPDATKWVDELRGGDETEQPYKEFANRMYRETNGRMRIDPVTGDVGIGSPSEQQEQKPMAWIHRIIEDGKIAATHVNQVPPEKYDSWWESLPLYTEPQKREWQGLTVEDIGKAAISAGCDPDFDDGALVVSVARAIEAKLKEKNT